MSAHGRHRPSSPRRAVVAVALSALVHVVLGAVVWVTSWWGFGGVALPRREFAVEIVGVSPDPSAEPPAPPPLADDEKKPPAHKPARVKPPRAKLDDTQAKDKQAKDEPVKPPPVKDAPPARDDAPQVATPKETPPPAAAEDHPDVPWPLDEPAVAAASAVDLPGAAPGDAALLIAFRLDRLRDGPWATSVERILAPMPDYQTIIAGSTEPLAQLFDLLFIATPDVLDVTATFLAAHHQRAEAELEQTLAGTGTRPRVTWAPASGGTVGKRARGGGVMYEDPRVFLIPEPGWIVLARPEHLPGMLDAPAPAAGDAGAAATTSAPAPTRPRWMQRLVALVGDPKAAQTPAAADPTAAAPAVPAPDPGPIAICAIANLGRRLVVPGVGAMPAPAATVVSVFVVADGFRVVAVLDFASDQAAGEFAAAAARTRDAALGSIVTRHFIAKVSGERALAGLKLVARGRQVAAFTRVSAADARVMLDAAAEWSVTWFERQRRAEGTN